MRTRGRPKHDRLRAFRFALLAKDVPASDLTVARISSLLGIGASAARGWRTDWLKAISPVQIEDVPPRSGQ